MEKDDDPWSSRERGFGSSSGQFDPKEDNPWDRADGEFSDTGGQSSPIPVITKQMLDKKAFALLDCSVKATYACTLVSAAATAFILSRRYKAGRLTLWGALSVPVGGFLIGSYLDFNYGYRIKCKSLNEDYYKSRDEYMKHNPTPEAGNK